MGKPLATLTVQGIITDPAETANKVFMYYLKSLYSQSTLYHGTIHSMKQAVRSSGMDPSMMCGTVKNSLTELLTPYYESVDIKTRHEQLEGGPQYRIFISGTLLVDGHRFDLNKTIDFTKEMFKVVGEHYE